MKEEQVASIVDVEFVLMMYKNEHEYTDYNHDEIERVSPVTIGEGVITVLDSDWDGPVSVVTLKPDEGNGFKTVVCEVSDRNQMSCNGSKKPRVSF